MLIFAESYTISSEQIVALREECDYGKHMLVAYTNEKKPRWILYNSDGAGEIEFLRDALTIAWAEDHKLFSVPDVMENRRLGAFITRTKAGGLEL